MMLSVYDFDLSGRRPEYLVVEKAVLTDQSYFCSKWLLHQLPSQKLRSEGDWRQTQAKVCNNGLDKSTV